MTRGARSNQRDTPTRRFDMRLRRQLFNALAVFAVMVLLATGARAAETVCFVYVSPIGDAGWSYQHDQGRKQMEKALAGKVQTKLWDNIPQDCAAQTATRRRE